MAKKSQQQSKNIELKNWIKKKLKKKKKKLKKILFFLSFEPPMQATHGLPFHWYTKYTQWKSEFFKYKIYNKQILCKTIIKIY